MYVLMVLACVSVSFQLILVGYVGVLLDGNFRPSSHLLVLHVIVASLVFGILLCEAGTYLDAAYTFAARLRSCHHSIHTVFAVVSMPLSTTMYVCMNEL